MHRHLKLADTTQLKQQRREGLTTTMSPRSATDAMHASMMRCLPTTCAGLKDTLPSTPPSNPATKVS